MNYDFALFEALTLHHIGIVASSPVQTKLFTASWHDPRLFYSRTEEHLSHTLPTIDKPTDDSQLWQLTAGAKISREKPLCSWPSDPAIWSLKCLTLSSLTSKSQTGSYFSEETFRGCRNAIGANPNLTWAYTSCWELSRLPKLLG